MGILILFNIIVLFLLNYHLLKRQANQLDRLTYKETKEMNNQDPYCNKRRRKKDMNEGRKNMA